MCCKKCFYEHIVKKFFKNILTIFYFSCYNELSKQIHFNCCVIANTKNKCIKIMIKTYLINNTNFIIKNFLTKNTKLNKNQIDLLFDNFIEKTINIIFDFKKNDYCENIKKIHITFFYDKKSCENNIYIKYQMMYFNHYKKCDMYNDEYCLIDCEHDIYNIDESSYIIIERYIDLLIECNLCERLRIENMNFYI